MRTGALKEVEREIERLVAHARDVGPSTPRATHSKRPLRTWLDELASLRRLVVTRRAVTAAPAIAVDGLEKRYGATRAVDGLSFTVEPGEVFGLLGPERRGQDDDRRDPRGLPPARCGHRARARTSTRCATARSCGPRSA